MWMFFGLLAAVAAASVSDVLVASRDDEDNSEDRSGAAGPESQSEQYSHVGRSDLIAFADDIPPPAPYPDLALEMGLFDDLDERIHSSDMYPPAQPPQPVYLQGGAGDDRLIGSVANDTIVGGAGDDVLIGAGGNNILQVDSGANHLIGGEGDDTLIGGAGNDTLEGGWGNDLLFAGGGQNVLMGGAGNDTLVGAFLDDAGQDGSGVNFLNGGAGDDLLIAGQGDTLSGGEGEDSFALGDWLAGAAPAMIVDYSPEQDQIVLHYDPDRLTLPDVGVTFGTDQPDMAEIRLNGQIVAHVANAPDLTADAIAIVAGHPAAIAAE